MLKLESKATELRETYLAPCPPVKAAADVLGGALLLRMKTALREYILYYPCRIFTCFHSQVPKLLVRNSTRSNMTKLDQTLNHQLVGDALVHETGDSIVPFMKKEQCVRKSPQLRT